MDQSGNAEKRLNLVSNDQKKYQAKTGEWIDFGDRIDLPRTLSVEVIQRENLMWVAGGVFQGQIGSGKIVKNDLQYDLNVKRGWIKVFIKPDSDHPVVRIETENGVLSARDAEFWVSARPNQTEIYVLRGEVYSETLKLSFVNRTYSVFEKGKDRPRYISKDWEPELMEVKIASSYKGLIKLSNEAKEDWDSAKTLKIYAKYRKKGWRKASRLDPESK